MNTPPHLLAFHVTPADEQDRAQVARLAQAVQAAAGATVEVAYVDWGHRLLAGGPEHYILPEIVRFLLLMT